MPDRREVERLLDGAIEAEVGDFGDEFAALEVLLGYVYDDHLRIPTDPAKRDELVDAFVRLGWTRTSATPESER